VRGRVLKEPCHKRQAPRTFSAASFHAGALVERLFSSAILCNVPLADAALARRLNALTGAQMTQDAAHGASHGAAHMLLMVRVCVSHL
jgi:hypothetical protein